MLELLHGPSPGTVLRGVLEAPLQPDASVPFASLRGEREGPTLLVTAGVHGAEYASIDAAPALADTDPRELGGSLVILPIVNPGAFRGRSISVNLVDGRNLHRVFPGHARGTSAERPAGGLHEGFLARADALIDLHGVDPVEALEPFSIYARRHEASRQLALAFGLPHVAASDISGDGPSARQSLHPPPG